MKNKIISECSNILDESISNIQKIVQIPSVRDVENAKPGAPFGPAIAQALELYLSLCSEIGMRIYKDPEGFYGYAEVGPQDAELVGVIGHLDVVPVGDEKQWTEGLPFSGDIVDDKIIGRGTLDDKGPMVLNLMAIKALINAGVEFNKRIRLVVGTAEETTWECINKYVELEEMPSISYSPDAEFPLINAEKTIVQFDLKSNIEDCDFSLFSGGAYNAVADSVTYKGTKADELVKELDTLEFNYTVDEDSVTVIGRSAHSMACFKGDNAISKICIALFNIGVHTPGIDFIAQNIKHTTSAELICGEVKDEVSGILTLNIGNCEIKGSEERFGFDSRIPVLVEHTKILEMYKSSIKNAGGLYVQGKVQEKLYVSSDSKLVKTLMKAYIDVSNDVDAKPLSTGGGTYSRSIDNCVAFGMVFQKEGMLDLMHQPNECLEIKFIKPALEIYATALYELQK